MSHPKGRHPKKKNVFFRALPEWRGGGLPMPEFLAPFFYQVTVLKMAIFYSNFTVIVCFLVIFVIIIIKITKIIIIIIIETIIIIIKKKFRSYGQNVIFDIQKREPSCPNWGDVGGG